MFQCNVHVEMNTFLCSLACTSMTIIMIIDGQFYKIDSLSVDDMGIKCYIGGCLVINAHADV